MKITFTLLAILALSAACQDSRAQDSSASSHPLLDKYYPQPQQPVNTAPPTQRTTSLAPSSRTQAPVNNSPVSKNIPSLPPTNTDPGPEPTTAATHAITTDSTTLTTAPVTGTIASKPVPVARQAPVQQNKSYDPNSLYDTRLGSSSPLYDTYEKNSNGAGTVTISPK